MPIFKSPHADIAIPTDQSIYSFVAQRWAENSDRVALIDPINKKNYKFGELPDLIRRAATGFSRKGVKLGDVVLLFAPNSVEYIITLLALQNLGAIPSTANPTYTEDELKYMLNDTRARFVVTVPDLLPKVRAVSRKLHHAPAGVFTFGDAANSTSFQSLLENDGKIIFAKVDPVTQVAIVPFSSGTTGVAKGVELTHYNCLANVLQTMAVPDLRGPYTTVITLPLFHIYAYYVALSVLHTCSTAVVLPKFDFPLFLQCIQDYKVTLGALVPPIVLLLAKHPLVDKYDLSSLKVAFCGAAPLGPETEQDVAKRLGVALLQGFGMTETAPNCCIALRGETHKAGSSGALLPNMVAKIVDPETGNELGVGQAGEIWVNGPNRMKGYWRNQKATADCIDKDGFYHTGDIGYVDENGEFHIVDRLKELIKYNAFQVPPAELEEILLTHPDIADAAVIGKPDAAYCELPTAFVVPEAGKKIDTNAVIAYVDGKVAPHKKLRGGVHVIAEIPKSAAGKILRRQLRATAPWAKAKL